ncbi:enoyl-CoA hydratase-related protein, partial [Neptuniibacter sp.]|uniref:enoyl-CoA hydratase/isomerase family protein n=1 Tax=Neptuniibacter sp. TaxID=1962643 RepID=UPI002605CE4C
LTGAGKGFCSGADLSNGLLIENKDKLEGWLKSFANPVIEYLQSMTTVIIAAVNGVAAGAGVSLALACDIAISAASARYVFSFSKIGLAMDMGASWLLNRRLGMMRTAALTMSADFLDAEGALKWGLVNEVIPDKQFMLRVEEFASLIASRPSQTLKVLKSQINYANSATLSEAMDYEAKLQGVLVKTNQAQTLIKDFARR